MSCSIKPDCEQALGNWRRWWNHEGPVLITRGVRRAGIDREVFSGPSLPPAADLQGEPAEVVERVEQRLKYQEFPGDTLPMVPGDAHTASLAAYLGCDFKTETGTVWYDPSIHAPESYPELRFDPQHPVWLEHAGIYSALSEAGREHGYLVGQSGIGSNVEVLADLRGTQHMLCDFYDRPNWVKKVLGQINGAYKDALSAVYDIIKDSEGGSAAAYPALWAPGRLAHLTLDPVCMISPDMFTEFVLGPFTELCEWADYSFLHVDGVGALCHIGTMLSVDSLDVVQWVPGAGKPGGGDPCWYSLYRQVLDAGKSLQVGLRPKDITSLINAIGTKGVCFRMVEGLDSETAASLYRVVHGLR